MVTTLDLETSIHNKGNPFDTRNFIVSSHIKYEEAGTTCSFWTDPDFRTNIDKALASCSMLVGCNIKFDLSHLVVAGFGPIRVPRIWDISVAEFVLSGQTNSLASLNSLAERYSLGAKEPVVAEYWARGISTEDIPKDIVETYGNHDVNLTYEIYLAQRTDPRMNPALEKLILLMGLDLLVLLEMEVNGFKYNVEGSRQRAETLGAELKEIEGKLAGFSHVPINWDSGDQLSCFLYGGWWDEDVYLPVTKVYQSGARKGQEYVRNEYQHTVRHTFKGYYVPIKGTALAKSTESRQLYATAEPILLKLKSRNAEAKQIITLLLRRSTIVKLIGTYLLAMPDLIQTMAWADNLVHGQFNQTIARTGRLSSSKPNMQNAPEEVDEFFISRY